MMRIAQTFALMLAFPQTMASHAHDKISPVDAAYAILQTTIEAMPAIDPMPLQNALARHRVDDAVEFSATLPTCDESPCESTTPIRPDAVTDAEWRLFSTFWASNPTAELSVETPIVSFALIDLDDDGDRDLVGTYNLGGTGLFRESRFYRRDDHDGFLPHETGPGRTAGFTTNSRGADEEASFARIAGRTYLAFREGEYGEDRLSLSNAWSNASDADTAQLRARYRYAHQLAAIETTHKPSDRTRISITDELADAINAGLAGLESSSLPDAGMHAGGRCLLPDEYKSGDIEDTWPWRDTPHYTYETVADFPVRSSERCYSAGLVSYRSGHMAPASCCELWLFAAPNEIVANLPLRTSRAPKTVELIRVPVTPSH